MKRFKFGFLVGLFIFLCFSCQKSELISGVDENLAGLEMIDEVIAAELDMMTDEGIDLQLVTLKSAVLSLNFLTESCPVKTFDRNANPKVLTLDFGTGCKGRDGKTRSGKIIIKASSFEDMMSTREKTFENFVVEGRKIDGKIIKKVTLNRDEHNRIAEITEDITFTSTDGKVVTRKGTLTREMQYGVAASPADNRTLTWGEVKTTRADGTVVTKTIPESTPLVFRATCRQIVRGKATLTIGADKTMTIDYGNGECDNVATVTKGTEVKTIKLR